MNPTKETRKAQELAIQTGIALLNRGRNAKPNRRRWEDTLKQLEEIEDSSVLIAKQARTSISLAAARIGITVKTQEVDPYHVRVEVVK